MRPRVMTCSSVPETFMLTYFLVSWLGPALNYKDVSFMKCSASQNASFFQPFSDQFLPLIQLLMVIDRWTVIATNPK